jgi:hypothetical protein
MLGQRFDEPAARFQGDGDAVQPGGRAITESRAIHTTAGNHSGPRSTRGLESYATPPSATEALMRAEKLPHRLWEPCAGAGHIARVLRAAGHVVDENDLVADGVDFRARHKAPPGVAAIVTNPPFSLAADFVTHGLTLVPIVAILERIQFLESDARGPMFDRGKLDRILIFRNRVPRMHLEGWTGKHAAPAMTLAWFIFRRDHHDSPRLGWIRCERGKP